MADPMLIIVTDAGRAALVNAEHTGTNPVEITEIGLSAGALVPLPGMTALAGEIKRVTTFGGQVVAADTIHVTMFDDSADAYTLRSLALYLEDGTLFAIYGQADPILIKTASSIPALALDVVFADINAALVEFGDLVFVNPPATEEVMGVAEFADEPEANAGAVFNRMLSPARARAAVLTWLLGFDGAGSGLDADLLDGQHGAYYSNIIARLGFTPLDLANFTGAQILSRLLTVDGAGCGLDADLLDGMQATSFVLASQFTTGTTGAGRWWKQPDGAGSTVIIQQGFAGPISGQTSLVIPLAIPHANTDYDVQLTTAIPGAGDYDNQVQEIRSARTVNSITVFAQDPSSGGSGSLAGVNWSTRGY